MDSDMSQESLHAAPPTFHIISLFPEVFCAWLEASMLGKAKEKGIFEYEVHQLRDFSDPPHYRVDDKTYGGGGGMVLCAEPLIRAVDHIEAKISCETAQKAFSIYFSPSGTPLTYRTLEGTVLPLFLKKRHFILICGHYEGVDQRFLDHWVDLEISLGDFVLTGGELAALCFLDATIRQLPGVVGKGESAVKEESFSIVKGPTANESDVSEVRLLEYPQYTRPQSIRGYEVPPVLLSGDHAKIEKWRMDQAILRTRDKRPDLFHAPALSDALASSLKMP